MGNADLEILADAVDRLADEVWALREIMCKHFGLDCELIYGESVKVFPSKTQKQNETNKEQNKADS